MLAEAVKSVLETVSLARAVFEKAKRRDGESLLEELERLIQIGEPAPAASRKNQDLTQRRTSHERRASRLASISIAVPAIPSSLTGPPISSGQVLQTLPSAQILLRHLPSSITGFTPFIAPSSATALDERLSEWQKSSIALLREAVPELLSALHSVEDVWNLRHDLDALLKEGELEADIKKALEEEWGRRIEVVWENKLGTLIDLVEVRTRETGEEIRSKGGETGEPRYPQILKLTCRYKSGVVYLFRDAVPVRPHPRSHCHIYLFQHFCGQRAETRCSSNPVTRFGTRRSGDVRQRSSGRYADPPD